MVKRRQEINECRYEPHSKSRKRGFVKDTSSDGWGNHFRCFVATTVYGDQNAPEVETLKK